MLLTRLPLVTKIIADSSNPFDLHALDTPPAFILSQDQTLNIVLRVLADIGASVIGIDVALPVLLDRCGFLLTIRLSKTSHIIGKPFFVVKSPSLRGFAGSFLVTMGVLYRSEKRVSRAESRRLK